MKNIFQNKLLILIFISFIVLAVYSPSFQNGFTNYDDDAHLYFNPLVQSLSWDNIVRIFHSSVNKTYIPLTILSFSVEYYFFKLNPFIYHFINVLLHLAVTWLVFFLALELGLTRLAAVVAALIFGVHPIHVESVAWVTQRKDVLYTFFYLLSACFYWQYLQGKRGGYFISIIFGLLSILSKPMALSLPLSLFLLDWFARRKNKAFIVLDKIPYLLFIVPITWLTYHQHARGFVENWGEGILLWLWTLSFYLKKFFLPVHLAPLYPVPYPVNLANISYLIGVLIIIGIIIFTVIQRSNRIWLFAVGFYFVNIFYLLRFDTKIDLNIVADRFMYLPSIGICLFLGWMLDCFWLRQRKIILLIGFGLLFLLSVQTFYLNQIWRNSITLWTHTIKMYPQLSVAYNLRGEEYYRRGDVDLALRDFNQANALKPYAESLNNRAEILYSRGDLQGALEDYTLAIEFRQYEKSYNNRGIIYKDLGEFDKAMADYDRVLSINPGSAQAHLNKGNVYKLQKDYVRALEEYDRAIELNNNYAEAFNNRGNLRLIQNKIEEALADFNAAVKADPNFVLAYVNRALVYRLKHDDQRAQADLKRAGDLGFDEERYLKN